VKLTAFDRMFSARVATGTTNLGYSDGSNSSSGDLSGGGDVIGQPGDSTVVGLRSLVSLGSNMGDNTVGSVLTTISSSPWIAKFALSSNTGHDTTYNEVAASGATETLDVSSYRAHDVTLTADCTFTFTGATNNQFWLFTLILRQDGTGGWTTTWPGSVVWQDGAPTLDETAGTFSVLTFFTVDGGTTWVGFLAGGGGGSGGTLDGLSDVTITAVAEDDTLRYDGSTWINDNRRWEAVTNGVDTFVWEGTDLVHEWNGSY
jgi:hypothetical protein